MSLASREGTGHCIGHLQGLPQSDPSSLLKEVLLHDQWRGKGDKVLLVKMTKINTNIEWQKRKSSEGYFQSIWFLRCVPRMSGKTEFPTPVESLTIEWSQQQRWTSSLDCKPVCKLSPALQAPGGTGGMVAWSSELHSLHAIGSGPLWQPITHCRHVMQARVVLELRVGEQQGLLSLLV